MGSDEGFHLTPVFAQPREGGLMLWGLMKAFI